LKISSLAIFFEASSSYEFDEKARDLLIERAFLAICLGHSERLLDQERALEHYRKDISSHAPAENRFYEAGGIQTAKYLDIIRCFGHFPHRNAILGRKPTVEEERFLAETGLAPF
jgi:uncharacterized protein (DUF924 family)